MFAPQREAILLRSATLLVAGSVKGKNCDELAALPDCDGFLIGGASLKAEFIDCVNAFKCKI